MREARTETDPAELILNFGQILVVIVSLLNAQEETQHDFPHVYASQQIIVEYLLSVVEESYNDALHAELTNLVQEVRQDLGLI